MMPVKCFFLDPAGALKRSLRRFANGNCPARPGEYSYHDASVPYDVVVDDQPMGTYGTREEDAPPHDDERWPRVCACGYQFTESDNYQLFTDRLYRRSDTGEELTLREATPGAMWDAFWFEQRPAYTGPDGRSLVVKLPNGHEWMIDGPANNCTDMEGSHRGDHKCWVRHGQPPVLTVDKNGVTCAAGGGSILSGDYHGFLRDGEFT